MFFGFVIIEFDTRMFVDREECVGVVVFFSSCFFSVGFGFVLL